jgi:hypothetical protein
MVTVNDIVGKLLKAITDIKENLQGNIAISSASTYKDFSLQQGNIGPCKEFTRKWPGKMQKLK